MNITYEMLSTSILKSRFAQLIINECIRNNMFNIPVHLALGHEALSEVVSAVMRGGDKLLCSHRNIHYQLARGASLFEILEEFKLSERGLSKGRGGSMNLTNPERSIIYTSSILGNNLCVASGVALAKKIKLEDGVVLVVTGDGAMEEGAFYETILNARSMDLPLIIIVENNSWSLASQISERRKFINLNLLASSLGANYTFLEGNNPMQYYQEILAVRERVDKLKIPEILEVSLTTLGGWTVKLDESPESRYINYHAGLAKNVLLSDGPILSMNNADPVWLIKEILGNHEFEYLIKSVQLHFSQQTA